MKPDSKPYQGAGAGGADITPPQPSEADGGA